MKKILLFTFVALLNTGYAQNLPNMICHQVSVVRINPTSFEAKKSETNNIQEMDIYKIEDGELFISSPNRSEYRYNKLVEIEKNRYYSGHKTLLFDKDYKSAISTHTYDDEIRVIKFRCLRMKSN